MQLPNTIMYTILNTLSIEDLRLVFCKCIFFYDYIKVHFHKKIQINYWKKYNLVRYKKKDRNIKSLRTKYYKNDETDSYKQIKCFLSRIQLRLLRQFPKFKNKFFLDFNKISIAVKRRGQIYYKIIGEGLINNHPKCSIILDVHNIKVRCHLFNYDIYYPSMIGKTIWLKISPYELEELKKIQTNILDKMFTFKK